MIRFQALGGVSLTDGRGRELSSLLRQPKRLALLSYLAFARPRGFQRRDALLALFWPELDQSHARNALRQSVHRLRRALGQEAVAARGGEELGVDGKRLWCDVAAFHDALDGGRTEAALELYRGELLPALHVADAPEFESWLDEERAYLRRRACEAAWALADDEHASGNQVAAVRWARRLTELSPYDEKAARRLLELLDSAGDRGSALREYEKFARRLERELEVEPAPETQALVQAIRARARSAETLTAPPGGDASPPPAPAPAPPLSRAAASMEPPPARATNRAGARTARGRLIHASLPGIGLLVILGAAWSLWGPWRAASPGLSETRIAVLPFTYRGSEELAYLGEGVADLLSTTLDGAGPLRSADPLAVRSLLRQAGDGAPDRSRGAGIARRLGAGFFVTGEIVEAGGRIRISAALRTPSPPRPAVGATVEGEPGELFRLVDELTIRLAVGAVGEAGIGPPRVAAVTSHSLPAIKAYLEGEQRLRSGDFGGALEAFQRAVAFDSTFALAWYRLSIAGEWHVAPESLVLGAAEQAARYSRRLSDRDRRLALAFLAARRGKAAEAERLFRGIVAEYPGDIEAWRQLGEILFHYEPARGRPIAESRPAFRHVLAFEPDDVGARVHLARIAARNGSYEELDSLVDRIVALSPRGERTLEMRALRAFAPDDSAAQQRVASMLAQGDAAELLVTGAAVAVFSNNLSGSLELVRLLTQPSRPAEIRAIGHVWLAHLELARGRWMRARAELAAAQGAAPVLGLEYRALLSAAPFVEADSAELLALHESLAGGSAEAPGVAGLSSLWLTANDDLHQQLRAYLMGLLEARLGHIEDALRHATELERLEGAPAARTLARGLARGLRARVASRAGRTEDALRELEGARMQYWYNLYHASAFYSQAAERYLRARLLERSGQLEEALRWYGSFTGVSPYDLIYESISHLHRAEIYEQLGQPNAAAVHYAEFARRWQDCEPQFRPLLEYARRRLAALVVGPGSQRGSRAPVR